MVSLPQSASGSEKLSASINSSSLSRFPTARKSYRSYICYFHLVPLKFTDCIEPFLVRGNVLELDVESEECLCLLKEEGPEQWRDLRVRFVLDGDNSIFSSV